MDTRWGNCFIYAVKQWVTKGGYLVIRRTNVKKMGTRGLWWHFLWSPDGKRMFQFIPIPRYEGWWLPPPIFKGYVIEGEKERGH